MKLSDSMDITKFISKLNPKTFDTLKGELRKTDSTGRPKYYISMKENDDLCLLYYDSSKIYQDRNPSKDVLDLEASLRSCIIDKKDLRIVLSQFNRILYNNDTKKVLEDADWSKVHVEECYEGTIITVFYHNEWYVSTRRCLESVDQVLSKVKSYREMFDDAIEGRFKLDDLSKDHCYYFVLMHHKNRNIINYSNLGFGSMYGTVVHIMTTEKYNTLEVDYTINDSVKKPSRLQFLNYDELLNNVTMISRDNEHKKTITTEGYVIRLYNCQIYKSTFSVLKLQTDLYQMLLKIKPNNSNMHQSYLELYQSDKLGEYLPYFSKYHNDIINRINTSVKTMAQEILDIYYGTRKKKNPEVYKVLKEQYKKTIYGLHGKFIDFTTPIYSSKGKAKDKKRSITVHDVYHFLKDLPPLQLRQLFYERTQMEEIDVMKSFIKKDCLDIATLTTLMFQSTKRINDDRIENDLDIKVIIEPN